MIKSPIKSSSISYLIRYVQNEIQKNSRLWLLTKTKRDEREINLSLQLISLRTFKTISFSIFQYPLAFFTFLVPTLALTYNCFVFCKFKWYIFPYFLHKKTKERKKKIFVTLVVKDFRLFCTFASSVLHRLLKKKKGKQYFLLFNFLINLIQFFNNKRWAHL